MATITSDFRCDLNEPVKVRYLGGNMFSLDNGGNTLNVYCYIGDEPAELGGSVTANVIRADGSTVAVSGAISGNKAYVILPQAAYAVPGLVQIIIKVTQNTTVTTVAAVVATVYQSSTDTIVDPGQVIPSVQALIAQVEAAVGSIPADYSALLLMLAKNYSSSKTYVVGEYAWEAGVLKRCIVPITAGETYTAAHWTDACLGDDVSALKSATDALEQHFHNSFDFVIGGFMPDAETPEYYVQNRVRTSVIERKFTHFHVGAGFGAYIFYYDSSKNIVSGVGQTWQYENDFAFENYPYIRVMGRYRNNSDFSSAADYDFNVYSSGNIEDAVSKNTTDIDTNKSNIKQLAYKIEGGTEELTPDLVDGYVDNNGSVSNWGGSGTTTYKRTDYIPLNGANKVSFNGTHYSAFYNESKTFISPAIYGASTDKLVPNGAEYIMVSYQNFTGTPAVTLIYDQVSAKTVITCHGDSVTEGMNMPDAGTAVYGGDTYPSQLLTMLTDAGYNVDVKNYGHGGERSSDIAIRVGGSISAYLSEDVTIPSNNPMVSVGEAYVENYKVMDSKILSTAKNADGTPCGILFTQTGRNTRPVMVGNKLCNLYQSASGGKTEQFLQLVTAESEAVVLRKGSIITTGGSVRNQDICIVYMGINDGSNLTMEEWIKRNKSVVERHPNTIVLGATNGMWTFWSGMTGTDAEKRAAYLQAVAENFGSYYIDLYDIFTTDECIKIANAAGYLTDRTAEQIAADNAAFASNKTPPSLTESGTAGNVHFNAIGYYVMAKVIFDKLVSMGMI